MKLSREHSPLLQRWGNFRATHGGHEERERFKQTQHRLLQIHDDGRMMMGFADFAQRKQDHEGVNLKCFLPCISLTSIGPNLHCFFLL